MSNQQLRRKGNNATIKNTNVKKNDATPSEKEIETTLATFKKITPVHTTTEQRNNMILKANKIYNGGNIEAARMIYCALQYHEGMTRVAKKYYESGKILEALAVFHQAGSTADTEEISKRVADAISHLLNT